ncbi:hypothetical protein B0H14DRAFT_664217 [Mycena olivaceomarginata]|nr:hypothetical protein B0H14DRAFT_664217 [Mycena olivaceomarginata]
MYLQKAIHCPNQAKRKVSAGLEDAETKYFPADARESNDGGGVDRVRPFRRICMQRTRVPQKDHRRHERLAFGRGTGTGRVQGRMNKASGIPRFQSETHILFIHVVCASPAETRTERALAPRDGDQRSGGQDQAYGEVEKTEQVHLPRSREVLGAGNTGTSHALGERRWRRRWGAAGCGWTPSTPNGFAGLARCFMACAPAESTTADRAGNCMKVERIVAPIRKMGTVEGKVRRGAGTWGWRVRGLRVYIIVSAFRDR